jgi:hypothetical protein
MTGRMSLAIACAHEALSASPSVPPGCLEKLWRPTNDRARRIDENVRLSDAHGRGKAGGRPKPRHTSLAVNMAGALEHIPEKCVRFSDKNMRKNKRLGPVR